jgi:hypothetical protein
MGLTVVVFVVQDFGSDIAGRSTPHEEFAVVGLEGREAEIDDADVDVLLSAFEYNVLGFEVSMDDALGVHVGQRLDDL